MYEDLIAGSLGSPGLVDAASLELRSATPGLNTFVTTILTFLRWCLDLFVSFSSFVRSEPLVMAVIALFFVGVICSIFFRVYKSC